MTKGHFGRYAKYYDALYSDKDYHQESLYMSRILKKQLKKEKLEILEIGSGTGKHAVELCDLGHCVRGIEPSNEMVAIAKSHPNFKLTLGDVRTLGEQGSFDCCIAMFHVLSYLDELTQVRAAFAQVAKNLRPGGIFVFDVWHGPAVLNIGPEKREKQVRGEGFVLTRMAQPFLIQDSRKVIVNYSMRVEHKNGDLEEFDESHTMRYFWPDELISAAKSANFEFVKSEESFSEAEPDENTWSVIYLFKKKG